MDHQEKQRLVIENETLRAGYDAARLEINHLRGVTKMVVPVLGVFPLHQTKNILNSPIQAMYWDFV